ncbi:MAG: SDR family oxidoreductase [Deltaproteobacteria bacterium]|nr:SDR family oxidoreductase [Deltaproteobacteria bacterium]
MDLGIEGRVALVCGASKGLGRAIAFGLAREGVRLAICARGRTDLEQTAAAIRADTGAEVWTRATDVAVQAEAVAFVQEAGQQYGTVDILINNAGGPPAGTFAELAEEQWQEAIRLNFLSSVWLCREAVPYMEKQQWGRIINLTSVAVKQPIDGLMLSNAARAGLTGFAKTLANELAAANILVNNICSGYILTDRVRDLAETVAGTKGLTPAEVVRGWEQSIPMQRLGRPEELANLVVFLASERASYITGTSIQVDGGFYRGLL